MVVMLFAAFVDAQISRYDAAFLLLCSVSCIGLLCGAIIVIVWLIGKTKRDKDHSNPLP